MREKSNGRNKREREREIRIPEADDIRMLASCEAALETMSSISSFKACFRRDLIHRRCGTSFDGGY